MKNNTLLTVDWDFFVPEDMMMDMGHAESKLFIHEMWNIRAAQYVARDIDVKTLIKTTGQEKTFWADIAKKCIIGADVPVFISESHLQAYELATQYDVENILSFDAHADLGYHGFKELENTLTIDCGNWLGVQAVGEGRRTIIVWPDHTHEKKARFKEILNATDAQITTIKDFLKKRQLFRVAAIHVCRSGAWTPPWLDDDFETFVGRFANRLYMKDFEKREMAWERIRDEALKMKELYTSVARQK